MKNIIIYIFYEKTKIKTTTRKIMRFHHRLRFDDTLFTSPASIQPATVVCCLGNCKMVVDELVDDQHIAGVRVHTFRLDFGEANAHVVVPAQTLVALHPVDLRSLVA